MVSPLRRGTERHERMWEYVTQAPTCRGDGGGVLRRYGGGIPAEGGSPGCCGNWIAAFAAMTGWGELGVEWVWGLGLKPFGGWVV